MEINKSNFKNADPKQCREWLIEKGYVYGEAFGWERLEVLEMFGLNPNQDHVPCVLKPKWVEVNNGSQTIKDEFGNSKRVTMSGGWEKHPTEKAWYPSDNWLAYIEYKRNLTKQKMAESLVPVPTE